MAKSSVRIDMVYSKLPKLAAQIESRAGQAVEKATMDAKAHALEALNDSGKSGRVYQRGGVSHQASAPGEAPARDTGVLAGSLDAKMQGSLTGILAVNAEYAVYLEMGTRKMAPRPFLKPAADHVKPSLEAALRRVADV